MYSDVYLRRENEKFREELIIIIAHILRAETRLNDLWPPANGREHNQPRKVN